MEILMLHIKSTLEFPLDRFDSLAAESDIELLTVN